MTIDLNRFTLEELLLIYFNQSRKVATPNGMIMNAFNYENYDNYSNYDNYDDYSNYDNYDDYTNYGNYDDYSDGSYSDEGGCFAKGTLISLKDGAKKKIEDIEENDEILVMDHDTGKLTFASKNFVRHTNIGNYSTTKLIFDDNSSIEIFDHHGFFDANLNKYVIIGQDNVKEYVGHEFIKINLVEDKYQIGKIKLKDYKCNVKHSDCYSILSAKYVNHVANSLLCVSDALDGMFNIFEFGSNLKYDENKKNADIEKYGLFKYDDWKEYVSEEEFEMFNMDLFKISIAKGLCSEDDIKYYANCFLKEYKEAKK